MFRLIFYKYRANQCQFIAYSVNCHALGNYSTCKWTVFQHFDMVKKFLLIVLLKRHK